MSTQKRVFAKVAQISMPVKLSKADDIMEYARSINHDISYIQSARELVEQGTANAERILAEITQKEAELKEFQGKVKELGIKEEMTKAKNVLSHLKMMKGMFKDMVKNGKSAISTLKTI